MDFEKARLEVSEFIKRVEKEPDHVAQVTKLSLSLFDQLILNPHPADRFLLESAAMLHDVGWTTNPTGKGHHKASERMILGHHWKSIPQQLVRVVANIARYHRKSVPKTTHPRYSALSAEDQKTVRKLAALLRVGDALDRSHMQLISNIRCITGDSDLFIEASAESELRVERYGVAKKSDLFELEFSLDVQLRRVSS